MTKRRRWLKWVGWVAAGLAVLMLVGPFLLPLPGLDTVPPEALAEPEDRFVTIDGSSVRYRTAGEGDPTFVLFHGFGASSRSWDFVFDGLAEVGRVVAFDRVGFGLTERPTAWKGESPYGGPAQVELTLGLMDAPVIDRGVLIAHSAGAETAVAFALDHPDRVTALVLESPSLGSGGPAILRALASTPQGRRVVRFAGRRSSGRIEQLLASAYHDPARVTLEILEGYRQPFSADDWDVGLAHFVAAPRLAGLEGRMGDLDMPLLILTGGNDTWIPTRDTIELAEGLAAADLVVVPECGHVAHEECTAEFLDAVLGWLAALR